MTATCIRNAAWVAAWDAGAGARARMFSATPQHDYAGRAADAISPPSLPVA